MGNIESSLPGEPMFGGSETQSQSGEILPPTQSSSSKYSKNVSPVENCVDYNHGNTKQIAEMNKCHEEYVRILAYDRWRNVVISGGGDGKIRCWNAQTFDPVGIDIQTTSVRSLVVLDRQIISGHPDGKVRCWVTCHTAFEMDKGPMWRLAQEIDFLKEAVYALIHIPSPLKGNHGTLIVGAEKIVTFSAECGAWEVRHSVSAEVLCMCVCGNGLIASGNMDRQVYVWDRQEWMVKKKLKGHDRSVWDVKYIEKQPGFAKLCSASADNTIRVWNADPNSENCWQCERVLEGHNSWVVSLSFGPNCLFSASNDGCVKVWSLADEFDCTETYEEYDFCEIYAALAYGCNKRTRLVYAGAGRSITCLEG